MICASISWGHCCRSFAWVFHRKSLPCWEVGEIFLLAVGGGFRQFFIFYPNLWKWSNLTILSKEWLEGFNHHLEICGWIFGNKNQEKARAIQQTYSEKAGLTTTGAFQSWCFFFLEEIFLETKWSKKKKDLESWRDGFFPGKTGQVRTVSFMEGSLQIVVCHTMDRTKSSSS